MTRIMLKDWLIAEGFEPTRAGADAYCEANKNMLLDSVQPALCEEGCEVEPDGRCEHGNKSISLALGII